MKRLQIMIQPELDAWLEEESARTGMSKGALVRQCVRAGADQQTSGRDDTFWELYGMFEGEPDGSSRVDEVVYGLER